MKGAALILLTWLTAWASAEVRFSVIKTGESAGSREAMVVSGGRWGTTRYLAHSAVLIQHPKGMLMWDTGLGRDHKAQMEAFSMIDSQLFAVQNVVPAIEQMHQNGLSKDDLLAIIPSHLHWDHASGLEDFLGVPIWVQPQELEDAKAGEPPSFLQSQFDHPKLNWQPIELNGPPLYGFAASKDLFGDGTLVLLDISGHTQGQVALLITQQGQRYLFIGDTTWSLIGVEKNASRPKWVNWMTGVDRDHLANAKQVKRLYQLKQSDPDLIVVPAHDEWMLKTLPQFPEFR